MYKEVDLLIATLNNHLNKCVYIETSNINWFFNVFSEKEVNGNYTHYFYDSINGLSNSHARIKDVKDRNIIKDVGLFVDVLAFQKEPINKSISWILDDKMFPDMKENYGKLLLYIKSAQSKNKYIVFIGTDYNNLPDDLKEYTKLIRVKSPTKEEIKDIITKSIELTNKDYIISEQNLDDLVNSAVGLSYNEIRLATRDSWNKHNDFVSNEYKTIRYDYIDKNPCLNAIKWENDYTDLIGLNKLKDFVVNMIKSGKGRGVLLVGVAGSGKSQFAKYIGHETNKLVVNFDLGKMKGKYVGETERMTRDSIETINSIGDCVVLVDEIEKGLSGASSDNDSGSSANQGATFLKWLSDRKEGDAYIIATANNIDKLPSEYKRAERWDGIFFLDLPNEEIRKSIIEYYIKYYKLNTKNNKVQNILKLTENWTGAEIKTMCRLASALNMTCLEIANDYITTIYSVDNIKIDKLREWSKGRTISCEYNKKINDIVVNKMEINDESI